MVTERYQRQRLLGQGLMSVVWLALDTSTQTLVALKIMTAIPEDDKRNLKANERFQREIDIARGLRHLHILPVLDYGYTIYNGRSVPFLVSPYIPDGSLAELVKIVPPWEYWSLPQTADAVKQGAESLWYLHTRHPRVVHEDVKPANFLVRPVQSSQRAVHLYLCDFGIARWQKGPNIMASEVLGTFAFMAPEQTEREVTPASDQYALAIVACFLLTGKLPIQAATNEEYIQAHLYDKPLLPSQLHPDRLPPSEVDDVIRRALEKSPARRFPTIMDFATTLEQAILKLAQEKAKAKTERLDVASLETVRLYNAHMVVPAPVASVENIVISIEPSDRSEHRMLDEPLPEKPRRANSTALTTDNLMFRPLVLKHTGRYELPARPKLVSWSPDGSVLACTLYGHAPLCIGKNGRMHTVAISGVSHVANCCWSHDGRVLAIALPGEIHFWDSLANIELPLAIPLNARTIDNLDWSVRGQLAVWVDTSILLYPLSPELLNSQQTLTPRRIATGSMRAGGNGVLRWSPDGSLLAGGATNGAILCWDAQTLALVWRVAPPGQKVNTVAWSPDGSLLAAAFRDSRVVVWDSQARSDLIQWRKLPTMPRAISISTVNRLFIASNERRLLSGLPDELFPSTTTPGQLLVACSPTNTELATLDDQKENVLAIWQA